MKSDHKYINNEIEYSEIEYFIEPIEATISISKHDFVNLFGRDIMKCSEFRNLISGKYAKLYYNGLHALNKYSFYIETISYTPHLDGYDFRMNPIDIMNNLFKVLKLDYSIPYINLDDTYGMMCLNDYIDKYTQEIIDNTMDLDIIRVMEQIKNNKKVLTSIYWIDINNYLMENGVPKDMLFYLSSVSLKKFIDTDNEVYTIMPYEYFYNVSHMNTSPYPHQITLDSEYNYDKYWFNDFRREYLHNIGGDFIPDVEKYKLENNAVVVGFDILRPGMVDRELSDIVARVRANPNVDYDKYNSLFEKKINFYRNSPYRKYIVGKYGLNGYLGFAYPNEYLVFDKFYNSDTIDPTRRTILTHGEAIYALPSDRFSIVGKTKQDIIEAKTDDDRIKKLNHTETFIERLEPIIYGPNVSTSTFEEELEKQKTKMLINRI